MTSFIIAGRDKKKREAYAKDFCAKQQIDPFDVQIIEKDITVKQNTQSIGIDDVKRFQKTVFLKPFKGTHKAVIIEDAHLLTTEAQNALLKVLEEPPEHTLLILGSDSREALLPTIQSRCQLILLEEEMPKMTAKEQNDINEFVQALTTMSISEKLKRAETLAKDKDKAVVWIEKVILIMRDRMLKASDTFDTSTLRNLQSLHTLLKETNVNARFAIEYTLLNISS